MNTTHTPSHLSSDQSPNECAQLHWDENANPVSAQFNDIYFNTEDGLAESRYVFIENNHLVHRFKALKNDETFVICETGFGTGLNFLATWQLWQEKRSSRSPRTQLNFISIEKYPLTAEDLSRVHQRWPELNFLSEQLIEQYPLITRRDKNTLSIHRLLFESDSVNLTLLFGDVNTALQALELNKHRSNRGISPLPKPVNAWYLDGFAPAKNPDMWSENVLHAIANLSESSSTLATFTAAGRVRRCLEAQGFNVQKIAGFGHKRDMLIGEFDAADTHTSQSNTTDLPSPLFLPWFIQQRDHSENKRIPKTAIIIGGGLAGCHTAYALSKRGIEVTLLERGKQIACGASGNPQGIVYSKLSDDSNPLTRFAWRALSFANRFYHKIDAYKKVGEACGVCLLPQNSREQNQQMRFFDSLEASQRQIRWIKNLAKELKVNSNEKLENSGIICEQSGWLSPAQLCELLLSRGDAQVLTNTQALRLNRREHVWEVETSTSTKPLQCDAIIIANANYAVNFQATRILPLKPIRGQITLIPESVIEEKIDRVICHEGYIAPPVNDYYCIGASFTLHNDDPSIRPEDHQHNLSNLAKILPSLAKYVDETDFNALKGRVSFRCTTPDYLPLIGPVPDWKRFAENYAFLRHDARCIKDVPGVVVPGLYCNVGHGSKGLAYTPLAAEILASTICGEALPVEQELFSYLHPGRFAIRTLKRNLPFEH